MSCKRFYEIYLGCYKDSYFLYDYDDIEPAPTRHDRIVPMLNISKDYQMFPLGEMYTEVPSFFLECIVKKIERLKIYE